jgi:hypothetical protein
VSEHSHAMVTLIGAALDAPLMAVRQRWPNSLHAVDLKHVIEGWERGTFHSVCGLKGLRLVPATVDGFRIAAAWPPRLRGLPDHLERCRTCWIESGRMRPRVDYRPKI